MEFTSTYYQSPLGWLRISGTENFISEVHFLKNENEQPVANAYPAPPPLLQQCLNQLTEYFNGKRRMFDVPLQQPGTNFQQSVWEQLIAIPFGKTISYAQLAKQLGNPKVIRAAASTNGKNNIAVIVPCHRVIGSNNDLVGYAGGLWRKQQLLALENKIANGVQTFF
jgi:methylated-DNA-[protein]-cysteine S-methyltransferase